jgi:hypothetical protein
LCCSVVGDRRMPFAPNDLGQQEDRVSNVS